MKIIFVHNKAMWYRIPFFNTLASQLDVKFYFTDESRANIKASHEYLNSIGIYPFIINPGLVKILFRNNYDLVILPPLEEWINCLICFVIAKIMNKPYILWSDRWNCKNVKRSFFKKIYYGFDKFIIGFISRRANACVTSGGTKQKKYFLSLGVSEDKIFLSPFLSNIPFKKNNFDDLENRKKMIEKELGITNKKIILCVARLIKRKGVNYLIEAFANLKKERTDLTLIIIGSGDYKGLSSFMAKSFRGAENYENKLINTCNDLNISEDVHFLGHITSENLIYYYYLCDLLVYPSIATSFADTGCLAVSDAMYFGKPVISTNVVGFAYDLIENGTNGFIVPEKNVQELNNAIKKILYEPNLEKKMGINSKIIISKYFNPEKMVEGFITAINYSLN